MQKKKILLIEDDPDTRDIISVILEEDGDMELLKVADIPAVIDIDGAQPDLILLDEWLPGKNGSEWCLELKSKKHTSRIPVVLISAVEGLDGIARQCRADGFIVKPFDIQHLKNMMAKTLGNSYCYK